MFTKQSPNKTWRAITLSVCALVVAGCAGLPRIDPTGERVLLWPQNQPGGIAPSVGNLPAQPVYTDPVFPQPTLQSSFQPAGFPGVQPSAVPGLAVPQDQLSITPDRVLAPIGSEVILRAGICTTENFLLTDQKVEWLIARESAGEFVALGGRGYLRKPWLPWNRPKKIDNQYATGYTAKVPLRITRGTADPSDDVQVEPGQAWASITSPVEGTSHITAVTPTVETWSGRRATATIYWIDVQWTFPPASLAAGNAQVLTTTVRRQSDGLPLEGWIVRYEVAGGTGALTGQGSGQVVEVVTGADGTASIDVTPTGADGATTQINTQLVRPERLAGSDFPRLVVASGSSIISWTGQSSPYLPPADDLDASVPTYPIPDQTPRQPSLPPVTGRPALEVSIFGETQAEVGSQTRFEVVISNRGNAPATQVVLNDRFDQGLSHRGDTDRTRSIEYDKIRTLGVGQSQSIFLDFDVMRSGQLCHDVTVRCTEGSEASSRACVNAVQPVAQKQSGFEVRKDGPRRHNVGDIALFKVVVKNTGEVPLTDLEIVDEYDKTLRPQPTRQGYEVVNGRIVWRLPRLEVGASETFEIQCTCLAPTDSACGVVKVTDSSGLILADDHCLEVLPSRGGAGDSPAATQGTLRLAIVSFADPVRAGQRSSYQILIENSGQTPEEQVQLRVLFPPELVPDVTAIRNDANVRANFVGNELRFDPIATLRANERLEFLIPVNVNQPGVVNLVAELISRAVPQPIQKTKRVEILGR